MKKYLVIGLFMLALLLPPRVYSDVSLSGDVSISGGAASTCNVTVSDTLRNSNDTSRGAEVTVYTKLKEVKLNANLPACRIKFALGNLVAYNKSVYAKIYKNGVAIGAVHSHYCDGAGDWVTYSEDFTGFVANDLIQIYAYTTSGSVDVKEMRFYYSRSITQFGDAVLVTPLETTADPTISMTNQDP